MRRFKTEGEFFSVLFVNSFLPTDSSSNNSLDLNVAESGVQQKSVPISDRAEVKDGCAC